MSVSFLVSGTFGPAVVDSIFFTQVPDHPHEHDQVFTNPNEACERYQYISLPLQPAKVTNIKKIMVNYLQLENSLQFEGDI